MTEKTPIAKYIWIAVGIILAFLHIEAWFTDWTFYGQNCRAAADVWILFGLFMEMLCALIIIKGEKSNGGIKPGHILLSGFFLVLALGGYAGFSFKIA